jgi:hypothetical protein
MGKRPCLVVQNDAGNLRSASDHHRDDHGQEASGK